MSHDKSITLNSYLMMASYGSKFQTVFLN